MEQATETSDARALRAGLEAGRIRRVLYVRASRLGDLLFTLPALSALRARYPRLRVTFLTSPYAAPLLAGHPDVDEVAVAPLRDRDLGGRRGRALARRLAPLGFELVLAPRPRPALGPFARALGAPLWPPPEDPPPERRIHVVEQTLRHFAALGVPADGCPAIRLQAPARERAQLTAEGLLTPPPIVLHPGTDETKARRPFGRPPRRAWPAAHWRALAAALTRKGLPVVLTAGSRREARLARSLAAGLEPRPAVFARRPLAELAALAAGARALVAGDTGPLHLATAFGTPVVGLYGPSPPEYTGPWSPGGRARVLRRSLPCAPCQGKDVRCPRNVCLEEIRAEEVLAALEELERRPDPAARPVR